MAEALATIPENKRPTFYAVAFANNHEAEIGPPHVKNEVKEYVPKSWKHCKHMHHNLRLK